METRLSHVLTPPLPSCISVHLLQVLHYLDGLAVSDAERDAPALQTIDCADSK